METTIMGYIGLYRGYIGVMRKKMETTVLGLGSRAIVLDIGSDGDTHRSRHTNVVEGCM